MRLPAVLPAGSEWLRDMPQGQGEVPPAGTPAQPVQEFHRRTVTERTSGQPTAVVEWLYASVGAVHVNGNGGTGTNAAVRTWVQNQVGLPEDDAGHIIGNRLGGLGTVFWNIFPQSRNINRGVFSSDVEQMIRNATVHGNVQIWFRFYYNDRGKPGRLGKPGRPGNPGRPNRFRFYILFPNGSVINNDIENPYKSEIMG